MGKFVEKIRQTVLVMQSPFDYNTRVIPEKEKLHG
jgi:hypothetical protein